LSVPNVDNLRHFPQPRSLLGYCALQLFSRSLQNIMTGSFQLSASLWLLANGSHVSRDPIS
jgi:hypothetical protein